jgi:predicted HAD superfamily Cof-like phosphohydrolase
MDNVFACGHIYSIPLVDIFKEVHRSNMAKLVDGKVLRRPDGKVQKPAGWTPPNIKAILFPEQV